MSKIDYVLTNPFLKELSESKADAKFWKWEWIIIGIGVLLFTSICSFYLEIGFMIPFIIGAAFISFLISILVAREQKRIKVYQSAINTLTDYYENLKLVVDDIEYRFSHPEPGDLDNEGIPISERIKVLNTVHQLFQLIYDLEKGKVKIEEGFRKNFSEIEKYLNTKEKEVIDSMFNVYETIIQSGNYYEYGNINKPY